MNGIPHPDPFLWDVDLVCEEFSAPRHAWIKYAALITGKIREEEIDGKTLLTYDMLCSKTELMDCLGIRLARHKAALVELLVDLRFKSKGFFSWKSEFMRKQEERSTDVQLAAETCHPASEFAVFEDPLPREAANGIQQNEMETTASGSNGARLKEPSVSRYPQLPLLAEKAHLHAFLPSHSAEINGTAEDPPSTHPVSLVSHDRETVAAKRRRIAPVQLYSKPVIEFPQPFLTEADSVSHPLQGWETTAENSDLAWEQAHSTAYLGGGYLPSAAIISSTGSLSSHLIELGDDDFTIRLPIQLPRGRRQVVEHATRRLLIKNSKKEALMRTGFLPMSTTSDDDNDRVLDLSDLPESLDEETRREMEAEQLDNEKARGPQLMTLLDPERVQSILEESICDIKAKWESTKLLKYQRKAHKAWHEARRNGTKTKQILEARSWAKHYDRRVKSLCVYIHGETWSKESELRLQSRCLEQSVEDMMHSSWLADMLDSRIEPAKPHTVPTLHRPAIVRARSPADSEILTSEDDDFIVPDEPLEVEEAYVGAKQEVEEEQEAAAMNNLSGYDSPPEQMIVDYVDLTQETPEGMSDSHIRSQIVDLISPVKKRRRSDAKSHHKSDVFIDAPDGPPIRSFEDVSHAGRFTPKHWAREKDRWRLVICLLLRMTHSRRTWIFNLLQEMDDASVWDKYIDTVDDESVLGVEQNVSGSLDLTGLFFMFLKVRVYKDARFMDMSAKDTKYLEDARDKNWPIFCSFLRRIAPWFPKDSQIFTTLGADEGIALDEDIGDEDEEGNLPASQNTYLDKSQKEARREIIQNKDAVDLREREQKRVEEQEARRDKLRANLAKLGTVPSDKTRLIINESKKDDSQSLIYVNEDIGKRIKDHQIEGVRFLWNQIVLDADSRQGCLLAHTMGLGKTMQVITLLVAIMEATASPDPSVREQIPEQLRESRTLVLCPSSLVNNWMDELLLWVPNGILGTLRKVDSAMKDEERDSTIEDWLKEGGVLLIGHSLLTRTFNDNVRLKGILLQTPNIVVMDEAHKLKNRKGQLNECCSQFRTESRIALTGSPLANNVEEYHSMIDWLAPNFLGPQAEFIQIYARPISRGLYTDSTPTEKRRALKMLQVLKDTVAPKVHRATIKQCLENDLPPKFEFVISVTPTSMQRKLYELYLNDIQAECLDDSANIQAQLFATINNLALICNHPRCFRDKAESIRDKRKRQHDNLEDSHVPQSIITSTLNETSHASIDDASLSYKVVLLGLILDEARALNDKVLVFSQSIPTLDYLSKLLHRQKRRVCRLDGSTEITKRQDLIKRFNDGSHEVFLISTNAGGVGLNIQGANRVVIFDFRWNPVTDQQAVGRAYRIGQNKAVFVYRFVLSGTFEDDLQNRAVFKTQLASRVVDKKNPLSWSKRDGELLHHIRESAFKDLGAFRGKDIVLDKLIDFKTTNGNTVVKSILSTDTFEEEDPTVALTAEERKEAEHLVKLNRIRTVDPERWARMKDMEERQANPYSTTSQIPVPNPGLRNTSSNASAVPTASGATYTVVASPSNRPHSLDGTHDAPLLQAHSETRQFGNTNAAARGSTEMFPQAVTHAGSQKILAQSSMAAPLPMTGANTFFVSSWHLPNSERRDISASQSEAKPEYRQTPSPNLSNNSIFSQPAESQAKSNFEQNLLTALESLQKFGLSGTMGPSYIIAKNLTTAIHECRRKESHGFLPDNRHWRLLDESLKHERFVLAAVSGHWTVKYLAQATRYQLENRIAVLNAISEEDFRSRVESQRKDEDPHNLENIRRTSVNTGSAVSTQVRQDMEVMREAADNRRRRASRLPRWADEALLEHDGGLSPLVGYPS